MPLAVVKESNGGTVAIDDSQLSTMVMGGSYKKFRNQKLRSLITYKCQNQISQHTANITLPLNSKIKNRPTKEPQFGEVCRNAIMIMMLMIKEVMLAVAC